MNDGIPSLLIQLVLIAAAVAMLHLAARRHGRRNAAAPVATPTASPASRIRGAGRVIEIGIWFGIGTGVLQLLLAFTNRFVRGHIVFQSPHSIWMTPIAYLVIFAAIGTMAAALCLLIPRLAEIPLVSGAYAWLGTFALLLPFAKLHRVSSALIAGGVAVQVVRVMRRQHAPWMATLRRSGLAMAGALAVVFLGWSVRTAAAERLAVNALPAPRSGAPNVLILILDTVRAANLGHYAHSRNTTPELARWAVDGTTFDWAFSTAPWTLMSHASMFTGLYPYEIAGGFGRPVKTATPTLAEVFSDRGYATGGFVANLLYTTRESGLADGFVHYDDYHPTLRQVLPHSWIAQTRVFKELMSSHSLSSAARTLLDFDTFVFKPAFNIRTYDRRPAAEITGSFLAWRDAAGERPFFAFLNFFDAHEPYLAPSQFVERVAGSERPTSVIRYDAAIANIDYEIGRLLDALRDRGALDNTIVIFTSDHGEQFGEHGLVAHGNSLYTPVLHVPLVIRYPARVPRGLRVDVPVTLRDLAATITDLAGVGEEAQFPGTSLAAEWADTADARHGSAIIAHVERKIRPQPDDPNRFGPMLAVFDEDYHYIRRGDGNEQLFAYRADPAEERDLAGAPEAQAVLGRLRGLLPLDRESLASRLRAASPGPTFAGRPPENR